MVRPTRRWLLLAGAASPFAAALSAPELSARLDSANQLHIAVPGFHFLQGKSLEHLKDGATVGFIGQLTLSLDANVTITTRSVARFAMSYDIWEERFSVARLAAVRDESSAKRVSHLPAGAAETWCLEHLAVSAAPIPAGRPFWIRLDLRAEDGRDSAQILGEPGINLTRLVEIFSRPARAQQQRWQVDAGPMRLSELRRSSG